MKKAVGEPKTQKLTLLMRPSVVKNAYKIVHMKHESLNNLVNVLLEKYVNDNFSYIQKYDDTIEED